LIRERTYGGRLPAPGPKPSRGDMKKKSFAIQNPGFILGPAPPVPRANNAAGRRKGKTPTRPKDGEKAGGNGPRCGAARGEKLKGKRAAEERKNARGRAPHVMGPPAPRGRRKKKIQRRKRRHAGASAAREVQEKVLTPIPEGVLQAYQSRTQLGRLHVDELIAAGKAQNRRQRSSILDRLRPASTRNGGAKKGCQIPVLVSRRRKWLN